jgi:hypothetical protein
LDDALRSETMAEADPKAVGDMDGAQVTILGSCVTRDAFNYIKDAKIVFYLARSSLASIYARPWIVSPSEDDLQIEGKGDFENRMLRHDIRKQSAPIIRASTSTPLVVDFIDERFDLFIAGDSIITRSDLLQQTAYGRNIDGVRRLRRNTAEAMDLWREAALRFLDDIQGRPLVLHRALWAESYRNDETGEILPFGEADLRMVAEQNGLLNQYYDFIEAHYEDVRTVAPDPALVYSDFAHRWGRDFYHFSESYYRDISGKMRQALWPAPRIN